MSPLTTTFSIPATIGVRHVGAFVIPMIPRFVAPPQLYLPISSEVHTVVLPPAALLSQPYCTPQIIHPPSPPIHLQSTSKFFYHKAKPICQRGCCRAHLHMDDLRLAIQPLTASSSSVSTHSPSSQLPSLVARQLPRGQSDGIAQAVHSPITASLHKFFNNAAFSDVTLVTASGKRIHCHKLVLAACSDRLCKLLGQGGMNRMWFFGRLDLNPVVSRLDDIRSLWVFIG